MPNARTPVIHDNKTPHKLFLLIACVLSGGLGLAFPRTHGPSIEDAFPGHLQALWYAGLCVGGVIGLLGITKSGITGALIEQAAMLLLTGIMLSFAVAAVGHTGIQALPAGLILTGFSVANAVRARQIHQDLQILRGHLRSLPPREGP